MKRFVGERAWHDFERSLDDGSVSLRDVLQAEAAHVRGTFDEIAALLREEIRVDASFADFVALCGERAFALTVVSSGIEAIIRDRLGEFSLHDVPVIANGIEADPAGWRIVFRDAVANGTDKAAIVRTARARGAYTIFIGDGRSDYDAAIAADVCFAKRGLPLERYLNKNGVKFTPFSSFTEICSALRAQDDKNLRPG